MKFPIIILLLKTILSLDEINCFLFDILSENEVCFEELNNECFSVSGVWEDDVWRPISLLPESPSDINLDFYLYTKSNPEEPEELRYKDIQGIKGSKLNAINPTVLIVHGFIDATFLSTWMKGLKDAYLAREDTNRNVIIVGWSPANLNLYEQATSNTRIVGAMIAVFIRNLIELKGVKEKDIHLIGHSLGGHIMGYVGKRFNETGKKIGRITGLDPAGPLFTSMSNPVRLVKEDADFVDVYHTDGSVPPVKPFLGQIYTEVILKGIGGLGILEPSGHIDIYLNGGQKQHGCLDPTEILGNSIVDTVFNLLGCDHIRAVEYFLSSIKDPNCFGLAKECESFDEFTKGTNGKCGKCKMDDPNGVNCVQIGEDADPAVKLPGKKLWVLTSSHEPYCNNNQ